MDPKPHTKFQHNASSRSRDMEKGCARAHVQLYPTHDLSKTHSYMAPKHTPNFNAIGPAVTELQQANFS